MPHGDSSQLNTLTALVAGQHPNSNPNLHLHIPNPDADADADIG